MKEPPHHAAPCRRVLFYFCADVHLTERPPRARAENAEQWLEAQKMYLTQLFEEVSQARVPLLLAGDLFDRWKMPPAVVNIFIDAWNQAHNPKIYAVPGQHDLQYHNTEYMLPAAYGTLCKAGVISSLDRIQARELGQDVVVHGFPWNAHFHAGTTKQGDTAYKLKYHVALLHRYFWSSTKNSFTGASPSDNLQNSELSDVAKQFSLCIAGDNHKPFKITFKNGSQFVNCGAFMCRHSNEIAEKFQPHFYRAVDVGGELRVERVPVDISQDMYNMDLVHAELKDVYKKEALAKSSNAAINELDFILALKGISSKDATTQYDFKAVVSYMIKEAQEANPSLAPFIRQQYNTIIETICQ